jgi:hypothetical protein
MRGRRSRHQDLRRKVTVLRARRFLNVDTAQFGRDQLICDVAVSHEDILGNEPAGPNPLEPATLQLDPADRSDCAIEVILRGGKALLPDVAVASSANTSSVVLLLLASTGRRRSRLTLRRKSWCRERRPRIRTSTEIKTRCTSDAGVQCPPFGSGLKTAPSIPERTR